MQSIILTRSSATMMIICGRCGSAPQELCMKNLSPIRDIRRVNWLFIMAKHLQKRKICNMWYLDINIVTWSPNICYKNNEAFQLPAKCNCIYAWNADLSTDWNTYELQDKRTGIQFIKLLLNCLFGGKWLVFFKPGPRE